MAQRWWEKRKIEENHACNADLIGGFQGTDLASVFSADDKTDMQY